MYSARLRHSPHWASAINDLSDPKRLNLQEANIATHDIAITIPTHPVHGNQERASLPRNKKSPQSHNAYRNLASKKEHASLSFHDRAHGSFTTSLATDDAANTKSHTIRFLLLTHQDLAPSVYHATITRLEALTAPVATPDSTYSNAIIFLLAAGAPNTASSVTDQLQLPSATKTHSGARSGVLHDVPAPVIHNYAADRGVQDAISTHARRDDTHASPRMALMQLQAAVMKSEKLREFVVFPMTTSESGKLVDALDEHVKAVALRERAKDGAAVNRTKNPAQTAIRNLLPTATIAPHGLNEHYTLALTDLFESIRDFAQAMDTEEGRKKLAAAFAEDSAVEGKEAAEGILAFWSEEWVCEL